MFIKCKTRISIVIVLLSLKILFAQDSLLHLEFLSPQAMEEFENAGNISFKVSFTDDIKYRLKTQFAYRGFELVYLNEGGEKNGENISSLSWSSKWMTIGTGRGQPHIAKGLVLGNTMMRFSPGLSGQAGISRIKLKIKNYNYYGRITYATGSIFNADVSVFRYKDAYCGSVQYRHKDWLSGVAIYGLDKPLMETWMNYKSKNVKTSFNASLASGNLNHVTADLYYAFEVIRIFVSAVYLHPEFIALQTDSKWGSGLKAGSQGYANGVGLSISPWKVSSLGYCVLRNNYKEQRFMLDLRYQKNPLEVILSYSTKNITELVEQLLYH